MAFRFATQLTHVARSACRFARPCQKVMRQPSFPSVRLKSSDSVSPKLSDSVTSPTFWERVASKFGFLGDFVAKKQASVLAARNLYLTCSEKGLDRDFYQVCAMPDTFQSWFLITQLHVYFCLVRLKQEGRDGSAIYKQMVSFFWQDVEFRIKQMGVSDSHVARESTRELVSMFYGLLFAYDEGLIGSDTVLASAIYRNLFNLRKAKEFNPTDLATVVEYFRREVKRLDDQDTKVLLMTGQHTFLPLRSF